MDFLVELFRNLLHHQDWPMSQACSDAYAKTLKQWHGWLASSSFSVRTLVAHYFQLEVVQASARVCELLKINTEMGGPCGMSLFTSTI